MSEISAGNNDGMDVGNTGEATSNGNESISANETASSTESINLTESVSSVSPSEISMYSNETTQDLNQLLETPASLEQAQKDVESYHHQSIDQILEMNGKYMSEADRARVSNGVNSIQAIQHNPNSGRTGGYLFLNGKSNIEVSAINQKQMERSTIHETNHFASKNREIIVPEPDKKGYTIYQTVGTRQSSWFHSNETGENYNYISKGRGLNEGLTTMYTNQQLTELSIEKGAAAERQQIYSHATELCNQLESIVGKDVLKEAYYGGNIQGLKAKVDSLAGEKGFDALQDCFDRTLSRNPGERVQAMQEAQSILAKMYGEGGYTA